MPEHALQPFNGTLLQIRVIASSKCMHASVRALGVKEFGLYDCLLFVRRTGVQARWQ